LRCDFGHRLPGHRDIIRSGMDRKTAFTHIADWATGHVNVAEHEHFRDIAESELIGLHEGNFARYRIRPAEFGAWQEIWAKA